MQLSKEIGMLERLDTNAPDASLKVAEIIDSIRNKEIKYFVNYVNETNRSHVQTYKNTATRNKYKTLDQLQELVHELKQIKRNNKRIDAIIAGLLNSTFFVKNTESILSKWKSKQARDYIKHYFTV